MRTHVKKVRYKEHVRHQVLAGLSNHPETGTWVSKLEPQASYKNSLEGCMGKAARRGRRAKAE